MRDWLYSPQMRLWASGPHLNAFVRDPFYQRYFAASDPFFAQTMEPFCPEMPLFLVPRTGQGAASLRGLPGFEERYQHMTRPKIETLRSWGWNIRVCDTRGERGTSFSGGTAQQWVLESIREVV